MAFTDTPKKTFLGFQRLTCPNCKEDVVHPLTPGYRTTYWVILGFMTVGFFAALSQGSSAVPGGLSFAALITLVHDNAIKKRVRAIANTHRLQSELPPLVLAAAEGDNLKVRLVVASGVSPDESGPDGQTALMLAARNGHRETVLLLLELGASRDIRTRAGNTARDIAYKFRHFEIAEVL